MAADLSVRATGSAPLHYIACTLLIVCACCSKVVDAMHRPHRYDSVYPLSYMFTYFVTVCTFPTCSFLQPWT